MKSDFIRRGIRQTLGGTLLYCMAIGTSLAAFTPPPNTVQFTLEGCRNDGNPTLIAGSNTLPNVPDGNFTCQDPGALGGNDTPYTTGNLGKGWNELDLVPHRLTTKNGNSTGSVTYDVLIAADNALASGIEGYDQIFDVQVIKSPDTLNLFSHSSCSVVVGAQTIDTSGTITGGIQDVIYRQLTITQDPDTTCVIDWANRLAIGASQFSGSSLQAYMFESENFQVGKRTVPIPVKDIEAAGVRKDMTATQGGGVVWNVTKQALPATVDLGNTCDETVANTGDVKIRVEWKVIPSEAGTVLVVTNIFASNPASRDMTVDVTDTIFGDPDGSGGGDPIGPLHVESVTNISVPAGTEVLVQTHSFDAPADVSDLSDTAVATFKDAATGIAFSENPEVTFVLDSGIQPGSTENTTAVVTDTEAIVGNGLSYAVTSTSAGSATGTFSGSYSLGDPLTPADADLVWTSDEQSFTECTEQSGCDVGFVEFNKTISAAVATATTGALSDWALLTASDGSTSSSGTSAVPVSIAVTSSALVDLSVKLTVPTLVNPDTLDCSVEVKNSSNVVVDTLNYAFSSASNPLTEIAEDLVPDNYTVTVTSCGNLVGDTIKNIDLTLPAQPVIADCSDSLEFVFVEPDPEGPVLAAVNKVTLPAGEEDDWIMTLVGPNTDVNGIVLTTSDADPNTFEIFQNESADFELEEGDYTVTETQQEGWMQTANSGCTFTVTLPDDAGTVKQCSFTNQKLGTIIIKKLTEPKYGEGFGFTHNIGSNGTSFTLDHGQSQVFEDVVPGSYTVAEDNPAPEFALTDLTCTESVNNSTANSNTRIANIELDPGETVECTYTNRQSGMVEIYKLTNGYVTDDVWRFLLTGPGVNVADETPPALLDFDGVKLTPGEEYTLCEVDIPYGWQPFWMIDSNGDGYKDKTLKQEEKATNSLVNYKTGVSKVFSPNGIEQEKGYFDSKIYCVNFEVKPGETLSFKVDNLQYDEKPESKPHDPKPEPKACYDKPINGKYVTHEMMQYSSYTIGYYQVDSCDKLSRLLDHYSTKGSADYLATQLLYAKLNHEMGYKLCESAKKAMKRAHSMLRKAGYSDVGTYPESWDSTKAGKWAKKLERYHQHKLCR
ncbi:prealbumin-like fold domain-containing protein [Photobacterium alginatilyticum]|uniref:prealbumin-like fold domain-containing protein n=1 Tax=Photobacterium alginatilyticum TaxID=1775171 RepID=UPI004068D6FE